MKKISIFPNESVQRVLIGTPTGHKHLRVVVETSNRILLFHEATLANVVRAFVAAKTHPQMEAVELVLKKSQQFRPGFASAQLLEQAEPQSDIQKKLDDLFAQVEKTDPMKKNT